MGKILGSKCKICRSAKEKLLLKGNRCFSDKCAMEKRPYPPGQHGRSRSRKLSNYGIQLRAKQKTKKTYGLMEKQFRNYFEKANRQKGVTGTNLLVFLESRLDTVVYRLGLALSRAHSRQLVGHNFFRVNGKKVTVPSYILQEGDVLDVNDQDSKLSHVRNNIELTAAFMKVPEWLSREDKSLKCSFLRIPERSELELSTNEQFIVELYSK